MLKEKWQKVEKNLESENGSEIENLEKSSKNLLCELWFHCTSGSSIAGKSTHHIQEAHSLDAGNLSVHFCRKFWFPTFRKPLGITTGISQLFALPVRDFPLYHWISRFSSVHGIALLNLHTNFNFTVYFGYPFQPGLQHAAGRLQNATFQRVRPKPGEVWISLNSGILSDGSWKAKKKKQKLYSTI